jgi:glycosyltransferase involved in cell wall biosynthesis
MRTVVFVFDYVMHYHRDVLCAVNASITDEGGHFALLTAAPASDGSGRVPLREPVVPVQRTYRLWEWRVRGFTFRWQRGVIRHLRRIQPDVVVTMCHSGTITEWIMILLKPVLRYRLVSWLSGYEYNPGVIKDLVLKLFVPRFDHHLAYHTNAAAYAIKYGALAKQVTVMHNTINEERIRRSPRDIARAYVGAHVPDLQNRTVLLYVGAVLTEKKLEVIVEALDILSDDRVFFLLVGDGPHLPELRRSCENRKDVAFVGRLVDQVGFYFDSADIFVLPGTGGLAINEAMAHGLPIVAGYADGSADDLVKDYVNGFRLREGTPQELAARLRLLIENPTLRETMGAASLEAIRTRYSFKHFLDRVKGVLNTV